MKDNDLDAFEKWFAMLDESHLNRVIKLNRGASQKAWQDACEYMQAELAYHIFKIEAENKEWREAARSEAEEVNELQAENKKLREAMMIYANAKGLVFTDKGLHLKDARNGSFFELQEPAREVLKEITPIE
jgi:hypothetical protein